MKISVCTRRRLALLAAPPRPPNRRSDSVRVRVSGRGATTFNLNVFSLLAATLLLCPLVNSSKLYVNYTGDIMLGALFPVHRRGSGLETCDKVQLEDGIQPLEALLYTLDKINQNPNILPGVRLGVLALDTCDSTHYALEQSLDFIKGFIAHSNQFHDQVFSCSDGSAAQFTNPQFDRIVGIIGGQSSSVSIQVANLLRLFQVPQISYMSTSPQLSNRERFPYFFRTVPSDLNQAHAILDILRYFKWTYVAVIYSDSEYGIHCYETLREVASNDDICFTTPQRVFRDQFKPDDYVNILRTIMAKEEIRVIILILEKEYTTAIMDAAQKLGIGLGGSKEYVWIGTDAWSSRESVGREDIVKGAIAIQPLVSDVEGFDEYFMSLRPEHIAINPWYHEFWESYFSCKLRESGPSTKFNENFTECDLSTQAVSPANGYTQNTFIHFVRDAAYAFAYALHNMHRDVCGGAAGLCEAMRHFDGPQLLGYLQNVTFKDEEESLFRFRNVGDGPTRYTIVNFQRSPSPGQENATYQWKKVGNYSVGDNGELELKIDSSIRYYGPNGSYPTSSCAPPCLANQVKLREKDDSCCWKCKSCGRFEIKHDEFHCDECKHGMMPDQNHSVCLTITETFIDHNNAFAIGAMAFASLGILMTVFVGMVFWSYNDTPIIKAAGRELSYVLLFGILLSFCVTFVIVSKPTEFTCGVMRFFLGFCPTLCYAAIVTKTNRIARIFHPKQGTTAPKTKYISPTSQMIIVGILTMVDIIINMVWIYWDPPGPIYVYPDRRTNLRICEGLDTYSYMVGFIYPAILIGFCTIYAIQTRKSPIGFNETKYIAFTNYTIIIIWLAFVPLYIASTSSSIRVVTLAISLSLSGYVEMACLFFPKIYIVLFKPEKNTKEVVMAPNRSSFLQLSNPASHGIPGGNASFSAPNTQSSPPPTTLNGKWKQHLEPEGVVFTTTGSLSDSAD